MIRSIYRSILRLHPPGFRQQFAEEMLWIYDETAGAGAVSLLTDGFFSLVRQWMTRPATLTLAAAGCGGAMHMALFLVMMIPVVNQPPAVIYVRRPILASGMPDVSTVRFSGSWIGTLHSTGPSGPMQLMLLNNGASWTGKLYLQGQDGVMHGGALEEIRVEGDALRFRVEAGDADLTFSGQLQQGKLTGILEATANGARFAPKGRKVGEGTWVMARAEAGSRAPEPRQRQS
ncbi:MAG TPA: hypothetical protein VGZ73_21645 [Bryobacteraceae bacterium]|nr:hypothetical protein [Bryobacteraceae bacterium]